MAEAAATESKNVDGFPKYRVVSSVMKVKIVLIAALAILCLTGCWNRVEINDLAIVTAMGIDLEPNNNVRLSIQIGVPAKLGPAGFNGGGGSERSTFVLSEKGETISDAYRNLQKKVSRRIFFSHSRVLIIGEKLAKRGISHVIDFFTRYQEPRLNSYIMCTKGEASELLKNKALLEKVPAEETRELTKQGIGLRISIKDFWDMMIAEGIEPVAPEFNLQPMEKKTVFESEAGNSTPQMTQVISGAAVFHKDKLVGWMNDAETRGILYLRNELKTGIITILLSEKEGGGKISAKITNVHTEVKPEIQGRQLTMKLNIRSETNVLENESNLNINHSHTINVLQKKLESDIRKRVQLALDKAQKQLKSDIFGFGRAVYKTYPKEWNKQYKKNWDQTFPKLKVSIQCNVMIRRVGLTKDIRGQK